MKTLLSVLLGLALLIAPSSVRADQKPDETKKEDTTKKDKKAKKDKKDKDKKSEVESDQPLAEPKDAQRDLARILRDMQMALEGSSPRSFLGYVDSTKFDDYPRFEDMVERLLREDTIRAYFRTVFNTPPKQNKAQMMVDGEMEVGRKDGVGQLQRRKQQLVIDFEYTRRGWKIVNITPRDYFQPL